MSASASRPYGSRDVAIVAAALLWLLLFTAHFFAQPLSSDRDFRRTEILAQTHWLLLDNVLPAADEQARNSGWRFFPQRFDLLFVAGTMLLAAWCTGRLLLRAMRLEPASRSEGAVFAIGLGFSAWTILTLALGLAGALSRPIFLLLMLAVTGGELIVRSRKSRETGPSGRSGRSPLLDRQPLVRPSLSLAVAVAVAPFLLAMLLGAMLPTTDFDVKEYHLQGPKEWYQLGRITFLPHNAYSSFPFLTEMLSLWGMVLRGDWYRGALVGQVVLMSFAPLTAVAVYSIAARISTVAGWLAAGTFLTIPWVYRISIIAYAEGGLTFFLAATFLAWLGCRREFGTDSWRRSVLLCGLLAGSALACKYPGLVSVTVPIGVAVVATACVRRNMRRALTAAAVFSLGAAITFGPWAIKNLAQTGNPVYPLAYTIFGGRDWTPELNEKWREAHKAKVRWNQPAGIPGDLWNQAQEVAVRSVWQSPLVFGLAPLALLVFRRSKPGASEAPDEPRSLVGSLILYSVWMFLIWWGITHRIDRFWLPMLPVICALSGIGAAELIERMRQLADAGRRGLAAVSTVGLTALLFVPTAYNLAFVTTAIAGNNGYLLDETAARRVAMQTTPSIAVLESRLPAGSRVLLVGEAAVFDAEFELRYNTVFDFELLQAWATDDPLSLNNPDIPPKPRDEILAALHEQGITHVFVNWLEIVRYREPGSYTYTEFVSPRTMQQLVDRGVLTTAPLSPQEQFVQYEGMSANKQQVIDNWAPELRSAVNGTPAVRAYELYTVAQ